jgi:hypothetical protein
MFFLAGVDVLFFFVYGIDIAYVYEFVAAKSNHDDH